MFFYNDEFPHYVTILLVPEFKLKAFKLKMSRYLGKEIKDGVSEAFFRWSNCFEKCVIYGNKLGYYKKFQKTVIM